jgi:hypothetical protein
LAKQQTPAALKKIYQKKLDFIDKSLGDFDKDVKRLQTELFDLLITDYVSQLTVIDGIIVLSEKNARLLAGLDKVMTQFKETFALDTFQKLGEGMIKMTDLTSDYFRAITGGQKIIDSIASKLDKYRAAVGIDKKGVLIEGSFLDNLANTPELKTQLSKYMQTAVTTEMDYRTFANGLKDMVKGSEGTAGAMERYVGTYAHDTFFQQARQQDNFFADQLGLDYFLWEGELIKTSRPLCVANHGKVFSREQLESLNNRTWAGKIPDVDIFSQVAGYQCRHTLRAITSEMADEIGVSEFDEESFE